MQMCKNVIDTIGNTPLIKLKRASQETGCQIYGKAEFLNPGGSVKDRAALYIIRDAEKKKIITPADEHTDGGIVVEGTAGNTGIGLCLVSNALGYRTIIVIPKTQSQEKKDMLRLLGAMLIEVPAVPYKHPDNYQHRARHIVAKIRQEQSWGDHYDYTMLGGKTFADFQSTHKKGAVQLPPDAVMRGDTKVLERVFLENLKLREASRRKIEAFRKKGHIPPGVLFADQWNNLANRQAHYETTGPEIWKQTKGKIDAFICSIGTGGTLAGVSSFLRKKKPKITIGLSDPLGASMYSYFKQGTLTSKGESITEGIGLGRVTNIIEDLKVDKPYRIPDKEALPIIFDLLKNEGLCLGGSSGINIAGAIRLAKEMGPGKTIVTILCDYGAMYRSKIFNPQFLKKKKLPIPNWLKE